jgi:hypothetical protein
VFGDGEISARIVGFNNTPSGGRGGIIMRESLDPNSKMMWSSFSKSETNNILFRDNFGLQQVPSTPFNQIYWGWTKIIKRGNILGVYSSDDGVTFFQNFEFSFSSFSNVHTNF